MGIRHARGKDCGVFIAVEMVAERVPEGFELSGKLFEMLPADAERLYTNYIHGVLIFSF